MATISSQLLTLGSVTMATPPTATSGMTVSLTTTTPAICTVSGITVTMWLGGTCSIAANQAGGTVGSTNYAAALQVVRSFVISAPAPVALSKRGGIDIDGADGNGIRRSAIVVRSVIGQSAQMQAGRLAAGQITFTPMIDPGADFRLAGITDFDGNGKSDLAFENPTLLDTLGRVDVLARNDFVPANQQLIRPIKPAWIVQAVGDLDGDGLGDLVWRWTGFNPDRPGDTGVSYIWFTNPVVGGLPEVRKRGGAPLDWTLLGAADINFDGAADMLYISPAGQIRVLMATNNRTCANLLVGNMPAGFTALKFADFTGGRRGDILLRNATTGEVSLMSLNAAGYTLPIGVVITDPDKAANAPCTSSALVVATSTRTLPVADPTWQFYASGDLDGDGIMDIVWLRPDNTLVVWLMNAGGAAPTVLPNVGTAPVGFSVFQP